MSLLREGLTHRQLSIDTASILTRPIEILNSGDGCTVGALWSIENIKSWTPELVLENREYGKRILVRRNIGDMAAVM